MLTFIQYSMACVILSAWLRTTSNPTYFKFLTETKQCRQGEEKNPSSSSTYCKRRWNACWKSWRSKTPWNGKKYLKLQLKKRLLLGLESADLNKSKENYWLSEVLWCSISRNFFQIKLNFDIFCPFLENSCNGGYKL